MYEGTVFLDFMLKAVPHQEMIDYAAANQNIFTRNMRAKGIRAALMKSFESNLSSGKPPQSFITFCQRNPDPDSYGVLRQGPGQRLTECESLDGIMWPCFDENFTLEKYESGEKPLWYLVNHSMNPNARLSALVGATFTVPAGVKPHKDPKFLPVRTFASARIPSTSCASRAAHTSLRP